MADKEDETWARGWPAVAMVEVARLQSMDVWFAERNGEELWSLTGSYDCGDDELIPTAGWDEHRQRRTRGAAQRGIGWGGDVADGDMQGKACEYGVGRRARPGGLPTWVEVLDYAGASKG